MKLTNALVLMGVTALPLALPLLDDGKAGDAKPRDTSALIQQLGDKDYKARKEAFKALEQQGPGARRELEKALESDSAEVRFNASLLLDRLADKSPGPSGGANVPDVPDVPDDFDQELREAMARMEAWQKQFEQQHPGFFDDRVFGGHGSALQLGPGSSFTRKSSNNGVTETVIVKVDENGRVTATTEKNGEKSTVEAESMEALRRDHPELAESITGGGGMQLQVHPFGQPFGQSSGRRSVTVNPVPQPGVPGVPLKPHARSGPRLERPQSSRELPRDPSAAPERNDRPDAGQDQPSPADDQRPKLGIQVAPVSAELADYLELDPDAGLMVEQVVAGSAAEKIGLKRRDIVLEVNGATIRGIEDVAAALADQDPADAEVVVLRRGAEKTLRRPAPSAR